MTTIDFRMTSNALFSDVVLPAATWYEKYDLSSTDLHPFVHAFNEAIAPPWEAKSDWEAFHRIAKQFSRSPSATSASARTSSPRRCSTTRPMRLPSRSERCATGGPGSATPSRGARCRSCWWSSVTTRTWRSGGRRSARCWRSSEVRSRAPRWKPLREIEELRAKTGAVRGGVADGRPSLERVEHACEAILALSGTTNGRLAVEGFRSLEARTGVKLTDLASAREGDRIEFQDAQTQPRMVITSAEWSGIESHGRRYSPFTINTEREKPWHTLSGRQHFYLDHQWMLELGEGLPVFRPPLHHRAIFGEQGNADGSGRAELTLRYLTPHSKWSIHSEYQDNLHMLTLFRGGGMLWISREDAEALEIRGQRLGRGVQPQRRDCLSRRGLAPNSSGDVLDVSRQGPASERAVDRASR